MMSFWFGTTLNDFLFKGFNITTLAGFLGVCAATAVLAFLLLLISYYKEHFKGKASCVQPQLRTLRPRATGAQPNCQIMSSRRYHAICTFFTLCQTTVGYFLMLIAMTYNAYLLIALVVGSSLAYFLLNNHFTFHQSSNICHLRANCNLQTNVEERGSLIENLEEANSPVTAAEVHE